MPPHLLTDFEIQKYQNKPKFNGIYSRNNLSKIKDRAYAINLDEYESKGTHWIALYVNGGNTLPPFTLKIYFDSFRIEHILQEIRKFIGNIGITNIYRIQA